MNTDGNLNSSLGAFSERIAARLSHFLAAPEQEGTQTLGRVQSLDDAAAVYLARTKEVRQDRDGSFNLPACTCQLRALLDIPDLHYCLGGNHVL